MKEDALFLLTALAITIAMGQLTMGIFFGFGSLTTWMLVVAVEVAAFITSFESDEWLEDLVTEVP